MEKFLLYAMIGIKHVFLCIKVCWSPREALKHDHERRGFQHLTRGTADENVSENHDCSLLLHKYIVMQLYSKMSEKTLAVNSVCHRLK